MRKSKVSLSFVLILLLASALNFQSASADTISPNIKETSTVYSSEKPNSGFYGSGVAGRMSEASALRFEGEQDTADGKLNAAIHKLQKALQLDPGDPGGHILYAKALSRKIQSEQDVTPQLVEEASREWKLIWHHDADQSEQFEAHLQARKIDAIGRALNKKLKHDEKIASRKQELAAK